MENQFINISNKYIIAYHIKLIKEQRYFSKAKLCD
jgi:hypothetical protein